MSIRDVLDADPALRRIPDEYGWTPPVPVQGRCVVFAYVLRGFPPRVQHVIAPRYKAVVSYPDWKVQELAELPIEANDDLGEYILPTAFASLEYQQFVDVRDEFERLLTDAIGAFLKSGGIDMDSAQARRLRQLFPVFAKEPLMPRLRSEASPFFRALDAAAEGRPPGGAKGR